MNHQFPRTLPSPPSDGGEGVRLRTPRAYASALIADPRPHFDGGEGRVRGNCDEPASDTPPEESQRGPQVQGWRTRICRGKTPCIRSIEALILGIIGTAAFHLAYSIAIASILMVVFLYCLIRLGGLPNGRRALYAGLVVGLAVYAPQLTFFWSLFGAPAMTLWVVLAFWIGLFAGLTHFCQHRLGALGTAALIPFVWTGLEYFRSELYYLRFSWLNVGFAFSESGRLPLIAGAGVYGMGFITAALAAGLTLLPLRVGAMSALLLVPALAWWIHTAPTTRPRQAGDERSLVVAGVQVEFPAELQVSELLDEALAQHSRADLFMLSEYTFDGLVPRRVRDWCRKHEKYLVAGGKEAVGCSDFYNTAFVIGPAGETVFQQAKSVPIQFFRDGLPARERKLWDSPWGKLGICICYDLSYSRVMDDLVRQGAQAILVPTMDVVDWGRHEHELHARVAPFRAAEYGIPIFRVASSGVSQWIDRTGRTMACIPFAEQCKSFSGDLKMPSRGRLPFDRRLAPFASIVTGALLCWAAVSAARECRHRPWPHAE